MKTIHSLTACALVLLAAAPALAHHSSAGIDTSKTLSTDATLKSFAWSAPHAQIIVDYKDESGKEIELSVTTFAPGMLIRQGFSPKDFRRGDKIKLFWHPNRSGSPGGILSKIVTADGRVMTGEVQGGAPGGGPPGGGAPPYP
jgi:hypothetical protein